MSKPKDGLTLKEERILKKTLDKIYGEEPTEGELEAQRVDVAKMTNLTDTESAILSIIKPHIEFSETINQHEIAGEFMFHYNEHMSARAVRRTIERLIEQGEPIISTPHAKGGYCYGGGDSEAIECYRRLRRKGVKILLRARRILRNSMKGQQRLFDIDK